MASSHELLPVAASDPRYRVEAYEFIFAALDYARRVRRKKRKAMMRQGLRRKPADPHLTGQQVCRAVRDLALRLYGPLGGLVLGSWGLRSTSDIGNVVFNLIESGDLERRPTDTRADFDQVYDFAEAFRPGARPLIRPERTEGA
jgi:uncharacterized repeat protein (TIGR04138 family)